MTDYSAKLLIDGALVDGEGLLDVVNPATGETIAQVAKASAAQLDQAVSAGRAAFARWSNLQPADREEMLNAVATAIGNEADRFAHLLTLEQGKPKPEARDEIDGAIGLIRFFASMRLESKVLVDDANQRVIQQWAPLGVVASIMPWNFPMVLLAVKVFPALIAGNTVVAKPSPTTPLTTLLLGELCANILPAGVLNIIVDNNDLGDALVSHPGIAKVTFTGSTATGKKVMANAAASLKRITLELGGNDPAIVLDDADVKSVARKVFAGATANCGQICAAIKRVYVHDSQYDEFCDEIASIAEQVIVGDGLQQGVQMGPLQNRVQFQKVKRYIDIAKKDGTVIAGGTVQEGSGFFVAPTIVRDIEDNSALVREEQFGPVLPILSYGDIDDVVRRANDSEYGLCATVWGRDLDRAEMVASQIDSGTVWVNQHMAINPTISTMGFKQSGIGFEFGQAGLEAFSQQRIIEIAK